MSWCHAKSRSMPRSRKTWKNGQESQNVFISFFFLSLSSSDWSFSMLSSESVELSSFFIGQKGWTQLTIISFENLKGTRALLFTLTSVKHSLVGVINFFDLGVLAQISHKLDKASLNGLFGPGAKCSLAALRVARHSNLNLGNSLDSLPVLCHFGRKYWVSNQAV